MDVLTGTIGVGRSKNGYSRRVPMNSVVRSVLFDLASARPDDGKEPVFWLVYRTAARAFEQGVQRAAAALTAAGKDASHLDGYTWHGNRHTFASRLVMAGVDPLTVKELGGWRTLAMVQRYATCHRGTSRKRSSDSCLRRPRNLSPNWPVTIPRRSRRRLSHRMVYRKSP